MKQKPIQQFIEEDLLEGVPDDVLRKIVAEFIVNTKSSDEERIEMVKDVVFRNWVIDNSLWNEIIKDQEERG